MNFKDIPKFTDPARYAVDVEWRDLERHLGHYSEYNLQLCPDFQRGHVWAEEQQIAYVEFKLAGGGSGEELQFNCPGWMNSFEGDMVLVDGLQRLTAVLRFLHDEIPAYGHKFSEYEGHLPWSCRFKFNVNNLKTKAQTLKWYLEMNSGGTPHSKEEIKRVQEMLDAAKE